MARPKTAVKRLLMEIKALSIWLSYLLGERLTINWYYFENRRATIEGNGEGYTLTLRPPREGESLTEVILHEIAHVRLEHVRREAPTRQAVDDRPLGVLPMWVQRIVVKREEQVHEWVAAELPKWERWEDGPANIGRVATEG